MISSIVEAVLSIGCVMGLQPNERNTFAGWVCFLSGCSARYPPPSNRVGVVCEHVRLLRLWLRTGSRIQAADPCNPIQTARCVAKNIAPSLESDLHHVECR